MRHCAFAVALGLQQSDQGTGHIRRGRVQKRDGAHDGGVAVDLSHDLAHALNVGSIIDDHQRVATPRTDCSALLIHNGLDHLQGGIDVGIAQRNDFGNKLVVGAFLGRGGGSVLGGSVLRHDAVGATRGRQGGESIHP